MARPLLRSQVESVVKLYRHARICITPGGEPHVKIINNGEVVDKLHIDIKDRSNTYKALCALKDKIIP